MIRMLIVCCLACLGAVVAQEGKVIDDDPMPDSPGEAYPTVTLEMVQGRFPPDVWGEYEHLTMEQYNGTTAILIRCERKEGLDGVDYPIDETSGHVVAPGGLLILLMSPPESYQRARDLMMKYRVEPKVRVSERLSWTIAGQAYEVLALGNNDELLEKIRDALTGPARAMDQPEGE